MRSLAETDCNNLTDPWPHFIRFPTRTLFLHSDYYENLREVRLQRPVRQALHHTAQFLIGFY